MHRTQQIDRWVDGMGDPLIVADLEGRICGWLGASSRRYGWQPAEAEGQLLTELLGPAALPGSARLSLSREGRWIGGAEVCDRDGRVTHMEVHATLVDG